MPSSHPPRQVGLVRGRSPVACPLSLCHSLSLSESPCRPAVVATSLCVTVCAAPPSASVMGASGRDPLLSPAAKSGKPGCECWGAAGGGETGASVPHLAPRSPSLPSQLEAPHQQRHLPSLHPQLSRRVCRLRVCGLRACGLRACGLWAAQHALYQLVRERQSPLRRSGMHPPPPSPSPSRRCVGGREWSGDPRDPRGYTPHRARAAGLVRAGGSGGDARGEPGRGRIAPVPPPPPPPHSSD